MEAEESSLFFLLKGKLILSYNKVINQKFEERSVFLFPANSSFLLQPVEDLILVFFQFSINNYFEENYIADLLSLSNNRKIDFLMFRGRMKELFLLIDKYCEDNIELPALFDNLRHQVFLLFKLFYTKEELSGFFNPVISSDVIFKDFILKHCLQVTSLDELAELANYSKSGFVKKFYRCFNTSPHKWILKYKAERILHEISATHKTFKEIADQYGFCSQSYFYTFCKIHCGASPGELKGRSASRSKKR